MNWLGEITDYSTHEISWGHNCCIKVVLQEWSEDECFVFIQIKSIVISVAIDYNYSELNEVKEIKTLNLCKFILNVNLKSKIFRSCHLSEHIVLCVAGDLLRAGNGTEVSNVFE